jgi:hypothetical protein
VEDNRDGQTGRGIDAVDLEIARKDPVSIEKWETTIRTPAHMTSIEWTSAADAVIWSEPASVL